MTIHEKINYLRKKNKYSQEELADILDVSRQAISKWEGGQAVPELSKIVVLADIFGVSIDELSREELDISENIQADLEQTTKVENAKIIMQSNILEFIDYRKIYAKKLANAIFLFIISGVPIILLSGISFGLNENLEIVLGLLVLFACVIVGLTILLPVSFEGNKKFDLIKSYKFKILKEDEALLYNIKNDNKSSFVKKIIIHVALQFVAVMVIIAGTMLFDDPSAENIFVSVCIAILIIAIGVSGLVRACMDVNTINILLQIEDYSPEKREKEKQLETFTGIYWAVVTAVFLFWSFTWNAWQISWLSFAVGGVLYGGISEIFSRIKSKSK